MPDQTHNIDWDKFVAEKFALLNDTAKEQTKAVSHMYDTLAEIIEDAEELQGDISELQNDIDEHYILSGQNTSVSLNLSTYLSLHYRYLITVSKKILYANCMSSAKRVLMQTS